MKHSIPILVLVSLVGACQPSKVHAQTPDADDAIQSALEFFARQQLADGSFEPRGQKLMTTGLSLLSFLSAGSTADGGRHAATVRRATEFLLRQTPGDRYFGRVDGSRMYGHAIVTLALCEAYGAEPDEQTRVRLRATLKDAVTILIVAQNVEKTPEHAGGWNEDRAGKESDLAISFWCRDALRAAYRIGLIVPKENLDRASAYLERQKAKPAPTTASTQPARFAMDLRLLAARYDPAVRNAAVDQLLRAQLADGSWAVGSPPDSSARAYPTAQAVLMLTTPFKTKD